MSRVELRKFPLSEVAVPYAGFFTIYINDWWIVAGDDVVFSGPADKPMRDPQCCAEKYGEDFMADVCSRYATERPDLGVTGVRQIPVVYVPLYPRDDNHEHDYFSTSAHSAPRTHR